MSILNGHCKIPSVEATIKANENIIEAFLEKWADPNRQDRNQRSAIFIKYLKHLFLQLEINMIKQLLPYKLLDIGKAIFKGQIYKRNETIIANVKQM